MKAPNARVANTAAPRFDTLNQEAVHVLLGVLARILLASQACRSRWGKDPIYNSSILCEQDEIKFTRHGWLPGRNFIVFGSLLPPSFVIHM